MKTEIIKRLTGSAGPPLDTTFAQARAPVT